MISHYKKLLKKHGLQGWWPIRGKYYPGDYSHPKNRSERFEICVGAIFGQNTSFRNVHLALENMRKEKLLTAEAVAKASLPALAKAIKSSGYYNQKAKKLKLFAKFFLATKTPTRDELLSIWGIGDETADSILLYAYRQPEFVVDAYTRKIFNLDGTYAQIKELFESSLPKDFKLFSEYHALIVAEGKAQRR